MATKKRKYTKKVQTHKLKPEVIKALKSLSHQKVGEIADAFGILPSAVKHNFDHNTNRLQSKIWQSVIADIVGHDDLNEKM